MERLLSGGMSLRAQRSNLPRVRRVPSGRLLRCARNDTWPWRGSAVSRPGITRSGPLFIASVHQHSGPGTPLPARNCPRPLPGYIRSGGRTCWCGTDQGVVETMHGAGIGVDLEYLVGPQLAGKAAATQRWKTPGVILARQRQQRHRSLRLRRAAGAVVVHRRLQQSGKQPFVAPLGDPCGGPAAMREPDHADPCAIDLRLRAQPERGAQHVAGAILRRDQMLSFGRAAPRRTRPAEQNCPGSARRSPSRSGARPSLLGRPRPPQPCITMMAGNGPCRRAPPGCPGSVLSACAIRAHFAPGWRPWPGRAVRGRSSEQRQNARR